MSYDAPPPPPPSGGSPEYGGQYGGGPPQDHPRATTILVLGILGLVCCSPLGIVAWVMGNNAEKEIEASGGQLGGAGTVKAGKICGIIAVVLMVLGIIAFVIMVILGVGIGGALEDMENSPTY